MKLRIVLAILLTSFFQVAAFGLGACHEGDQMYLPTAEFTKGNKQILFVGMVHTGPKGYYLRTRQAIDKYISQSKTPVTILTEFFTCGTEVLDVGDGSKLSASLVESLVQNKVNAKNISKSKCTLDVDGRTLRPAYLVKRNLTGCEEVHKNGFECQWGDLWLPSGKSISVKSGDLKMDTEPPAIQVTASMAYRDWSWVNQAEDGSEKWSSLFDSLILEKRNSHLVQKSINALKTSDRVILPWGSLHLSGIKTQLEALGFTKTNVGSVLYHSAEDLGKWAKFDEGMSEWQMAADPMDGNCRNAVTVSNPYGNQPADAAGTITENRLDF